MAKITYGPRVGGAGLGSSEVGEGCGLHRNWITTATDIDLSGGSATVELMVAHAPGRVQSVKATYTEAISADGDGTIVAGYIGYSSGAEVTDADRFATAIPTASAPVGTVQTITATSTPTFVAGDIITVGHTQKSNAGKAIISVEYTIDDEE